MKIPNQREGTLFIISHLNTEDLLEQKTDVEYNEDGTIRFC
jgi:hypothetical protein